jgi:hypothetical protein
VELVPKESWGLSEAGAKKRTAASGSAEQFGKGRIALDQLAGVQTI